MAGNRPKPIIKNKNLYGQYLAKAREIAKELSKNTGVVGILLSGGVSRGYADKESELDITIFLTPRIYNLWVNKLKSPIPWGDTVYAGQWCDFKLFDIKKFEKGNFSHLDKWDLSYAKILYDPKGFVQRLMKRKVKLTKSEIKSFLDENNSFLKVCWFPDVAEGWIKRGDLVAAQDVLNEAVEGTVEMVFLLNNEYVPFEKWRIHLYKTLKWKPKNFEKNIKEALIAKEFTPKDVMRRAKLIKEGVSEITSKARELGFIPQSKTSILKWLFKKQKTTLVDVINKFPNNKDDLLKDPVFKILKIYEQNSRTILEVDFEKVKHFLKSRKEMMVWDINDLKQAYNEYIRYHTYRNQSVVVSK